MTLAKGVLIGVGGLVTLGIALYLLKGLIIFGLLGGAGYLGYRFLTRDKALGSGEAAPRKELRSGDDFERKMRELEAIERRLDREISGR
ncbi:MAG: hypothetical protein R3B09_11320 [Nannocystaceae bacterium]